MKKLMLMVISIFILASCGFEYTKDVEKGKPIAVIKFEDGNEVVIELEPSKAPNTVNNFIKLSNDGFYDGVIFHRVIEDFMIQGGDPDGVGTGGPGYNIAGEMANNGFTTNDLKNEEGTIAMARAMSYDSAGSQFFINVNNNDFLDDEYAVFGKVTKGYEHVVEYSKVATDEMDKPNKDIKIDTIEIYDNGYKAKEVEKYSE